MGGGWALVIWACAASTTLPAQWAFSLLTQTNSMANLTEREQSAQGSFWQLLPEPLPFWVLTPNKPVSLDNPICLG